MCSRSRFPGWTLLNGSPGQQRDGAEHWYKLSRLLWCPLVVERQAYKQLVRWVVPNVYLQGRVALLLRRHKWKCGLTMSSICSNLCYMSVNMSALCWSLTDCSCRSLRGGSQLSCCYKWLGSHQLLLLLAESTCQEEVNAPLRETPSGLQAIVSSWPTHSGFISGQIECCPIGPPTTPVVICKRCEHKL